MTSSIGPIWFLFYHSVIIQIHPWADYPNTPMGKVGNNLILQRFHIYTQFQLRNLNSLFKMVLLSVLSKEASRSETLE